MRSHKLAAADSFGAVAAVSVRRQRFRCGGGGDGGFSAVTAVTARPADASPLRCVPQNWLTTATAGSRPQAAAAAVAAVAAAAAEAAAAAAEAAAGIVTLHSDADSVQNWPE